MTAGGKGWGGGRGLGWLWHKSAVQRWANLFLLYTDGVVPKSLWQSFDWEKKINVAHRISPLSEDLSQRPVDF